MPDSDLNGDELRRHRRVLLEACKLAYRKHHLGDDTIGWDELSERLGEALDDVMGGAEFRQFVRSVKKEG